MVHAARVDTEMSFVIDGVLPMTRYVSLLFFLSISCHHVFSQPSFEAGHATMRGR
jgi:hypothetical protein